MTLTSFGVGFILYLVVRVYQSLRKQMEELNPTLFVALNINPRTRDSAHLNPTKQMKKIFVPALIISAMALSSCATIFCGSKAKVTFESNIEQTADLTIDGRKHQSVTVPYPTKIKRGFDEPVVKAEAEGYETQSIYIDKKFNAVSVINLCDILGWGIDAATGAITKPENNTYQIDFVRKPVSEQKAE